MGGNTSVTDLLTKYSVTHISPEHLIKLNPENSNCNLVKNAKTNQSLECYQIVHDGILTLEQELEFYQYRKLQNKHLVKVEYIIKGNNTGFCSNKQVYKIYTERIYVRLDEIDDLCFMEALIVLVSVLEGLDNIKDGYQGILNLSERMIGINERGAVKVWINENYERNMPGENNLVKGYYQEGKVVVRLFELVKNKMADKQYPRDFEEMIKKCDTWKYQRAKKEIIEYVNGFEIEIPRTLRRFCRVRQLKKVEQAAPFEFQLNQVPIIQFVHFQPSKNPNQQHYIPPPQFHPINNSVHVPNNIKPQYITNYPNYPNNNNMYQYQFQKSQSSNNTSTSSNSQKAFHNSYTKEIIRVNNQNKDMLEQKIEDLSSSIKKQLDNLKKQFSLPSH